VHQPQPLHAPTDSVSLALALHAHESRLTFYAGAGLSMPPPTSLPSAAQLSRQIVSVLASSVDLSDIDPGDLVAVADRIAATSQGRQLLHMAILDAADFLGARANYAHEVLALLICEGSATVLVTNYDDCIERSAPQRLTVIWSPTDLGQTTGARLLKIHGCATHRDSLLVTSRDLAAVPDWVRSSVATQLYTDAFVFLGIGSPADYVREGLDKLAAAVDANKVHIVDPTIETAWTASLLSPWQVILPQLNADQRHAETAESFCDSLLRAYIQVSFSHIRDLVAGKAEDAPQRMGLEQLLKAFSDHDAVYVLRWLRSASFKLKPGKSVTQALPTKQGLLGLGALLGSGRRSQLLSDGTVLIHPVAQEREHLDTESAVQPPSGGVPVLLVTVHEAVSGSTVETELRCRVCAARTDNRVQSGASILVVVAGVSGRLVSEVLANPGDSLMELLDRATLAARSGTPADLVAPAVAGHLLDGVNSGSVVVVNANSLFEAV
jgi:hypothetical protein